MTERSILQICHELGWIFAWRVHTFILLSPTSSTFDPAANFVSAVDLYQNYPLFPRKALTNTHLDWEVWLQCHYKETGSIETMGAFYIYKLTLVEYPVLQEKSAPRVTPLMFVLTVKTDENLLPLRAKSRIVVLDNSDERT